MAITLVSYLTCALGFISPITARYLQVQDILAECPTTRSCTAVSGDTCATIARAHGVPRGSLIALNDIRADCTNLRVGQVLCIPEACELYPVAEEASCIEIAKDNDISVEDLLLWNSFLTRECTTLQTGDEVCIAAPELQPTTTSSAATTTSIEKRDYATEIVDPPGPVPRGTTKKCGQYYEVQSGDYCDSIADRFSVDFQLFRDINPAINDDCSNLVPGLFYCVSPTRDWNETTTTTTTPSYATAPAPTSSGTTSACFEWYVAQRGDTCFKIASLFGITVEDIRALNPSLKEDCSNLRPNLAYCIDGEPAERMSIGWVLAEPTQNA
ncbi:hypothetical protein BDV18DRAFT_166012 [Aspergillus unguis]